MWDCRLSSPQNAKKPGQRKLSGSLKFQLSDLRTSQEFLGLEIGHSVLTLWKH